MAKIKLIIGIGNPDQEYKNTRHNVGFMFLDYLAKTRDPEQQQAVYGAGKGPRTTASCIRGRQETRDKIIWEFDKKSNSLITKVRIETAPTQKGRGSDRSVGVILAKPQTYVNKSGEAVKKLATSYKLQATSLIVVQDDLDIPFGNTKMSFDKNSGGHKGVESIMRSLKTKKFHRLRIGIAAKSLQKARQQSEKKRDEFVVDYVLSGFSKSESEKLKEVFKEVYQKLTQLL